MSPEAGFEMVLESMYDQEIRKYLFRCSKSTKCEAKNSSSWRFGRATSAKAATFGHGLVLVICLVEAMIVSCALG